MVADSEDADGFVVDPVHQGIRKAVQLDSACATRRRGTEAGELCDQVLRLIHLVEESGGRRWRCLLEIPNCPQKVMPHGRQELDPHLSLEACPRVGQDFFGGELLVQTGFKGHDPPFDLFVPCRLDIGIAVETRQESLS